MLFDFDFKSNMNLLKIGNKLNFSTYLVEKYVTFNMNILGYVNNIVARC